MSETDHPPENAAPSTDSPAASQAASSSAGSVEVVRKVYVRDLREKDRVNTVFKVSKKSRITARSGKSFLAATLADKTGEVDARIFERIDEWEGRFNPDDYVLVQGEVIVFHGKPQVVIEKLERLDPEPIDPREFTPPPPEAHTPAPTAVSEERGASGAVAQIRELTERVQDPNVRALLFAFLDDPEIAEGLKVAPAAKGIHHAYKGGLADHILSVMRLTHRVADHYPMADRDLLLAGALLHDIGKVKELSYDKGNFDYTDEGRLVGHLVMTAQMIREKAARLPNFPPLLEHHITHLVLAHHGQLEYGSPKLPVTLEAFIVHALDSLDSRIASWLEAMARDSNERWTDVVRLYERHLWKGPSPTLRNRSPVEGLRRPRQERKRQRSQEGGGEPSGQTPRKERSPREDRKERAPHEERKEDREKGGEQAPRLNFKPLSVLAGEAPPARAGEAPPARAGEAPPAKKEGEP